MKHYHIWTIGCQMNEADSGRVAAELDALGYAPTDNATNADVIVLNTCVVRQSAEDRAVGHLWSLKPLKEQEPDRVIAQPRAAPALPLCRCVHGAVRARATGGVSYTG